MRTSSTGYDLNEYDDDDDEFDDDDLGHDDYAKFASGQIASIYVS